MQKTKVVPGLRVSASHFIPYTCIMPLTDFNYTFILPLSYHDRPTGHALPTRPEPTRQKMAQSLLNGTSVVSEEEGREINPASRL